MERPSKLLARCALFVLAYGAAFVVWTPLNLQRPLWLEPLAFGSRVAARLIERPALTGEVEIHEGSFRVTSVQLRNIGAYQFGIKTSTFTNVVPILLALAIVAPALRLVQRARLALFCLTVLYAINVLALTCLIEGTYPGLERIGETGALATQLPLGAVYAAVDKALGSYIAVLAMIFVIFGAGFIATVKPEPEAPSGDRNAPCPCGSGRKLKQCCGT